MKDYESGFIHIDIKYLPKLPDQEQRSYLFVAIDRATRLVHPKVCPEKSAQEAATFLEEVKEHAPFIINKTLTDNGKEFTDRFTVTGERKPTGNHQVDVVCQKNTIEHRLIKPHYPQTNGMVERFNRRIEELLQQTHLPNSQELIKTLEHYCYLYNHHIPQKNIGHQTPIQTLLDWYRVKPELFRFSPHNLTEPNKLMNYSGYNIQQKPSNSPHSFAFKRQLLLYTNKFYVMVTILIKKQKGE